MLLPRFPPAAPLPDAPSRPGFFSAALVSAPFPPPAPTKHVPAVAAALFPAPGPLALNGGRWASTCMSPGSLTRAPSLRLHAGAGLLDQGCRPYPGDVWQYLETFLVVTTAGGGRGPGVPLGGRVAQDSATQPRVGGVEARKPCGGAAHAVPEWQDWGRPQPVSQTTSNPYPGSAISPGVSSLALTEFH